MVNHPYGVEKVHGVTDAGEFLTGDMDFFTVRSLVDITTDPDGDPADVSQIALDKLVETISTRAQPIILGSVTTEVGPDYSDFVGFSGGTVYVLKFATEHTAAWGPLDNTQVTELMDALDGVAGFVSDGSTNNVVVDLADNL